MSLEEFKYFFSYTRKDSEFVLQLAKDLRTVGSNLWLDQLDVLGGQHWDRAVEEALKSCKGMIAVLSPESVVSDNVMDEVSYALDEGKLVVPVLIRSCDIPFRLRRVQYIDFTADYDTGFSRLLRALHIERPVQPPESRDTEEPVVQDSTEPLEAKPNEPLVHEKQAAQEVEEPLLPKVSEPIPDELDHPKPLGVETEKGVSKSQKTKMLAAICIVTLITIVSIGVFLQVDGNKRKKQDQERLVKQQEEQSTRPKQGDIETNSIGMKLVYIPAGSFMIGSGDSAAQLSREYNVGEEAFKDELPQHQVRISEGFWMGQTEVIQGQYESVMNAQPWSGNALVQEDANNPAVWLNWDDAAAFCRKLSQQESETYRLPTEAEWEYACRAGTTTRFSFGDSDSSPRDHAWFSDKYLGFGHGYAHSVGQKEINPWGLYDMHGNVFEWCSDYYDYDYYSNSPDVDPKGPSSGDDRCCRGSSWLNTESILRCSDRGLHSPNYSNVNVGFRVVRSQPGPHVEPDRGPERPEVAVEEPEPNVEIKPIQHYNKHVYLGNRVSYDDVISQIEYSLDHSLMVTWSQDYTTARLWHTKNGSPAGEPMKHDAGNKGSYVSMGAMFSNDESLLLTWSRDGTVRLWYTKNGSPATPPMIHDEAVFGATFSKDESLILTWSGDHEKETGIARLWHAKDGRPASAPMRHKGIVGGAILNMDESLILTWNSLRDHTARLWRVKDSSIATEMQHDNSIEGAIFNKDESLILTWSDDCTARLWRADNGEMVVPPMKHEGLVWSAMFSKDEELILTCSIEKAARLWHSKDGTHAAPPMKHSGYVRGAIFNSSSSLILTYSSEGEVRLWHAKDGTPAVEWPMMHEGNVVGATFSKDESLILSWSEDGTARLWHTRDGTPASQQMKHKHEVWNAVFSEDESLIRTWSGENFGGTYNFIESVWRIRKTTPTSQQLRHDRWVTNATLP